ncbi:MAG: nitroreductase, partial [Bacteroides sp.]|nr:nitroreductase [Bacteroides sp.]
MKKVMFAVAALAALFACAPQQEGTTTVEVNKEEVVVENILARRSVRSYGNGQVSQEQLETLMNCAINAPSAMNRQPWEVRVVQDAELLGKIREVNDRTIYNAPTVIFIAGDKENRFSGFDCGLLTQNIVLAAEAMDLGTVIVGSVTQVLNAPEGKEILDALELPENYEVMVGIC